MQKSLWALKLLYLLLAMYSLIFTWFLYVGPYTTYKVTQCIQQNQQRIVISLTTTPYRINKIKSTLDSLRAQSIAVDRIYLNIPYNFVRDNTPYVVPQWLIEYPGIILNRTNDYGPITKLLPALEQEVDPDTIIITVDDDIAYPPHVIRDLVQSAMQQPKAVITPINLRFTLEPNNTLQNITEKYQHGSKVALVVGAGAISYRRAFFNTDFITLISNLPTQCFLTDDLVISMYLAHSKIPIMQTTKNSLHPIIAQLTYTELPYRFAADSLSYNNANHARYAECLQQTSISEYAQYQRAFSDIVNHDKIAL